MIVVVLRGGLGNQMFQYAAGLSVALKYNMPLVLDTTILNDRLPRKDITFRDYDLDIFPIAQPFTRLSTIAHTIPIAGVWAAGDLALIKTRDVLHMRKLIIEKQDGVFDPAVLESGNNITLWGRWQSERYFAYYRDHVREAFRFKDALNGPAAEVGKAIQASASVSLHVRRGDYVRFKSMETLMGKTDVSYYDRAIAFIAERVDCPHFFIFSDDIAWCREHIKPPFPTTYLDETTQGRKSSFHLQLMSLCKHNIIANSTFSWWGAWLNSNPDKIVIAPQRWYHDISAAKQDIIPESWIALS